MARKMEIPTIQGMVDNLEALTRGATYRDVADGVSWYREAYEYAATLAAGTPYSVEQVCGVLAALSPQCPWSQNKEWARRIVEAKNYAVYDWEIPAVSTTDNRRKAWRCLDNGVDPRTVLGGPKVNAFYANLIGDESYVTVDVWAFYAATGIKLTKNQSVPDWAYPLVVEAYRQWARRIGLTPRAAQAFAWGIARGSYK